MNRVHWPVIGVLTSLCLFVAAAAHYPGGTTFSANTAGFDWTRNFISSLFQPTAINGEPNAARYYAIPAMAPLCGSLGYVFWRLSWFPRSKPIRKTIETGGIGSAVYAFLIWTPLHDLMVSISLTFFVAALAALLRALWVERSKGLFVFGMCCLAITACTATMYYGGFLLTWLPIGQKLMLTVTIAWLFAVYYRAPHLEPNRELLAT